MIQEAYVSFETAKLLKEKGFDAKCNRYYNAQYEEARTVSDTFAMNFNDETLVKGLMMEGAYSIPTQQMAMRWLREVHNRYITILTSCELDYPTFIFRIERYIKPLFFTYFQSNKVYESYEDAVEAAIKYCLTSRVNSEKEK